MAEALHIDRDRLILSPPDRTIPKRFWTMVGGRSTGEPVAYITGRRAFWNIDLHVGPGVLVPRPDSEVLIASAIEHFEGTRGPRRILDLGTGPGTLLLAALDVWPDATGLGIDVSRRALSYASANARRLGLRSAAEVQARRLGRGHRRAVRPHPLQPALCRRRRRAWPGRRANSSRTRRCSPAKTGSTPIARSPRSCRGC